MNKNDLADTQAQVNNTREQYLELVNRLLSIFIVYSNSAIGQKHVYRIYSRRDKQGGNDLKETWKILLKMQSRRLDTLSEVPDVVGLTIVSPFKSDLIKIVDLVEGKRFANEFVIVEKYEHKSFYEAIHFVVCGHGFPECKCEIQIKTMFHDAWSVKSHDLLYKPRGEIDRRFTTQMGSLSTILSALSPTLLKR
jgi:ppGpp synthetase/RelA/SpoT-type nucleotidyltranferase